MRGSWCAFAANMARGWDYITLLVFGKPGGYCISALRYLSRVCMYTCGGDVLCCHASGAALLCAAELLHQG